MMALKYSGMRPGRAILFITFVIAEFAEGLKGEMTDLRAKAAVCEDRITETTAEHSVTGNATFDVDDNFTCDGVRLDKVLRLYGKWYNIEGWNHPGGPAALAMGIGRDATTLFNMHHPFVPRSRLQASLERRKLSAREAACLNVMHLAEHRDHEGGSFEWGGGVEHVSEFRADLVKEVGAYFDAEAARQGISQVQATKATQEWWAKQLLAAALLALVVQGSTKRGDLWSVPIVVVLLWVLCGPLIHEGSHFALSTNWVVNEIGTYAAPMMSASWPWKIQHCSGHHAHINVPHRDPDLYHEPDFWRIHPSVPFQPAHALQGSTWPQQWVLAIPYVFLLREMVFEKDANQFNGVASVEPRPEGHGRSFELLLMGCMLLVLFVAPHFIMRSHWRAVLVPASIWFGLSFTFMSFSQVSHLDSDSVHAYDPQDFWNHTLLATQDWACGSEFWGYLSTGLNCQTIHHFFPTVSSCHYPKLQLIFAGVADQHGMEYRNFPSWWHVFDRYLASVRDLSKKSDSENQLFGLGDYVWTNWLKYPRLLACGWAMTC